MPSTGGRPRKDAKKGKASKADLLESAKRRQEQLKSLEGTREGRVCFHAAAPLFNILTAVTKRSVVLLSCRINLALGPVMGAMLSCQHQLEVKRICSSQVWLACARLCLQPLVEQVVPSIMDVLHNHPSLLVQPCALGQAPIMLANTRQHQAPGPNDPVRCAAGCGGGRLECSSGKSTW